MPAQSKQQQKFMGLVHAIQKGDVPASDASPEAQKVAKDMKPSDVKDFAATKHKGLPKKVKQEILKKLKEYAMTLPGHHMKSPAPNVPLRNDRDMDLEEGRIPQNFNVGTTQDYHTKLATTPRKKYDKTNFKPQDSGQPDLEDDEVNEESELKGYLAADVVDDIVKSIGLKFVSGQIKNTPNRNYIYLKLNDIKFGSGVVKMLKSKFGIDAKVDYFGGKDKFGSIPAVVFPSNKVISESIKEAQAVSGGKVHKFITGKNLKFKGKSYSEIDFETLGIDNKNQTIRLKIIAPKEIFGNEMSLDFRTVRRGPFLKTDTSKVNEGCWKGYKQVGGKMKDGRMVPNCVPESVNESVDTTSLKKIHDAVFKFLKTKKGVGEVKEFSEFPNRYGDNVSTFSVKYNIEDKYNYDLQEIKIEYSTSRVFIPNKGYFPFKTFNDIKNIINKKSFNESVKESMKLSDMVSITDKLFELVVLESFADPLEGFPQAYKDLLKKLQRSNDRGERHMLINKMNVIRKKLKLKPLTNESVNEASKAEIIKDLDKAKNDLLKKVDVLIAKKKKLYSDVDIESPMTADEKKLDKDIADLFSQINKLVLQKRNLKEASFHALNNPRMKKSLSNLVKDKKVQNPETGKDVSVQTAVSNPNHPAHDKAVSIKQSLLQRLKGMVKNEYASNLDNSYILNKDAKLDGTPEEKKAIGEELSFDEREMVVGIIEILKQVEDRKNRMEIALNMLKKFKEEGIEFDYQKFIDHLKEYSMGSYEYDKGNRELGEAMIMQAKDMVYKVIPKSTFARFASEPKKNREFVDSIIRDLTHLLNRFYKQNNIDLTLK